MVVVVVVMVVVVVVVVVIFHHIVAPNACHYAPTYHIHTYLPTTTQASNATTRTA